MYNIHNKKVVLAMSGGLDSTTLCGWYLDHGYQVYPIIFNYGSKHNKYENQAAIKICDFWRLDYKFIKLDFMKNIAKSNLMIGGGDIPEGHYKDENMKLTVVPGRNLIFASILASYAESIEADIIALGVHAGDHSIYPDCRPEFITALKDVVKISTDWKIDVAVPFLNRTKDQVLKAGLSLRRIMVPYLMTRTCYKDQELSCGKCGSCNERLEAFKINGKVDPVNYQDYQEHTITITYESNMVKNSTFKDLFHKAIYEQGQDALNMLTKGIVSIKNFYPDK